MSSDFIAHLQDLFADFGTVTARRMFGGRGLYASVDGNDEVFFALVIDEALYLKVDAQTQARFEAVGSMPFVYEKQKEPITTSYWSAPDAAMESAQDMQPWAQLAYAAALRKRAAPKRRKSSTSRKKS
jgi:DNA transformation protein